MTDTNCLVKRLPIMAGWHPPQLTDILFPQAKSPSIVRSILQVFGVIAACTLISMLVSSILDHENVIMIYLLGVTYLATRLGLVASACACILSVFAFAFFVVPPAFSFIPEDPQYAFTFAIMFIVALVMSILTHRAKNQHLLIKQAELLDLTNDAIIVWDLKNHKIVFWNSGAEKMYGLGKEQAIGQNICTTLQGEYPDTLMSLLEQAKVHGFWSGEITYKRFDNVSITVASRWTVKLDAAGNPEMIVEFATDITERKAAELRIEEFHSTVSHELRTPLTSIRGGLALLEHGVIELNSSEGSEMILLARTQSDKLITLVNNMLDLQTGKFKLDMSRFKADTMITLALAELAPSAAQKNLSFCKLIQSNPIVEADSTRIKQVLSNLLANAIEFAPPGSEIHVTAETKEDLLRISVRDSGPGIEQDDMSKLFSKFQQVDSSDNRIHGGVGLGLAVSKAIVEQHQGKIGLYSQVGRGSTFWFDLPVVTGDSASPLLDSL